MERRLPGPGEKRRTVATADTDSHEISAVQERHDQSVAGTPETLGVVPGQRRSDFLMKVGRDRGQIQEISQNGAHGCCPLLDHDDTAAGTQVVPPALPESQLEPSMTYSLVICNCGIT